MSPFFDTNVLIYAVGNDGHKADLAWERLRDGGTISVQVLNEFVSVSRAKYKAPWREIEEALANFRLLDLVILPLTRGAQEVAVTIARDHGLHIYDAMIVASAQEAGCDTLWTEDLDDGRRMGDLTIRNPFREPSA